MACVFELCKQNVCVSVCVAEHIFVFYAALDMSAAGGVRTIFSFPVCGQLSGLVPKECWTEDRGRQLQEKNKKVQANTHTHTHAIIYEQA